MASKKQKRAAEKRPPKFQRSVFVMFVVAFVTIGVVLDRVVLPRGGGYFEEHGFEIPGLVTLAVGIEAFFHTYLWPLAAVALALSALAWIGALDRLLKPGIATVALAVLVVGGATAGTWNTNQDLAEALQEAE